MPGESGNQSVKTRAAVRQSGCAGITVGLLFGMPRTEKVRVEKIMRAYIDHQWRAVLMQER
jgi:hypothetical protein